MVSSRKVRAKNEKTFLEGVKDDLNSLTAEFVHLRTLLQKVLVCTDDEGYLSYSRQCVKAVALPCPPAPPKLDIYNRDYLLQFRPMANSKDQPHIASARSPGQESKNVDVDWESLAFITDEIDTSEKPIQLNEPDDISAFILEQSHQIGNDYDHTDKDDTNRSINEDKELIELELRIAEAQQAAPKFIRLKENWATRRIQAYWKTCKSKLMTTNVVPFSRGFTSAKACGPHPGRHADSEINDLFDSDISEVASTVTGLTEQEDLDRAVPSSVGLDGLAQFSEDLHACSSRVDVPGDCKSLDRVYIDVPYEDKEKAISLGAVLDKTVRKFYAADGCDKTLTKLYPIVRLERRKATTIIHCRSCMARLECETGPCKFCHSLNKSIRYPFGAAEKIIWKPLLQNR